jgi:hypothetical protein
MKRILKNNNSEILTNKWVYPKDAQKIRSVLETEQDGYCAYTEAKISATYSVDIEHFNPNLKNTNNDSYTNWFAVSHKWNNKKSDKWAKYQPILHPTDEHLEIRVRYEIETGTYVCNSDDSSANNLIELLDLNNIGLINDRQNKIELIKDLFSESGVESFEKWLSHPKSKHDLIEFRRTIETVFNIEL